MSAGSTVKKANRSEEGLLIGRVSTFSFFFGLYSFLCHKPKT